MAARLLGALLLLACSPAFCQSDDLAIGRLLVASRDLGDPNFSKTVILLVHYDEGQGAVGLVLNKRTDVPISRVFHDLKEASGRNDPVYIGGPVELNSVLALLKSASKPEGAQKVFSDVYLISNKDLLAATLASRAEATVFHSYPDSVWEHLIRRTETQIAGIPGIPCLPRIPCPPVFPSLLIRSHSRHSLPDNQRVDVIRPLVRLHGLQVAHMPHDRILI